MPDLSRALRAIGIVALAAPVLAQGFSCDWRPTTREVVLDTDFTRIVTSCGPVNVAGGVFTFRNVHIPAGVTVRGTGSNPLILVCAGTITVDGTLSVHGGDGARVDTLNSANFPTAGGVGVCAGSNGGRGSPNTNGRSLRGERGWFGGNLAQLGGEGGHLGCFPSCVRGSGGGGGSFVTAGDPHYKIQNAGNSAIQQLGIGGFGCSLRTLPGGQPGLVPFVDGRADNDFFGVGVDFFGRRFVHGELTRLIGG